MNKTIVYLSQDTDKLKALELDVYFPESELHPREAVKLIPDLIGKSFCTHSQAIVNEFGHLIANGVESMDIEIRLIAEDGKIAKYKYDHNGYLMNWELGFFEVLHQ